MARYFFHVQTNVRISDQDGTELDGPIEARREAIRTCGEIMQGAPESFWDSRPWSVTVTDATGLILWEVFMDGFASAATTEQPSGQSRRTA